MILYILALIVVFFVAAIGIAPSMKRLYLLAAMLNIGLLALVIGSHVRNGFSSWSYKATLAVIALALLTAYWLGLYLHAKHAPSIYRRDCPMCRVYDRVNAWDWQFEKFIDAVRKRVRGWRS